MNGARVIVVVKRSSYARFVEDEGDPRAKLLLKKKDPSVARWRESHREHTLTVEAVLDALAKLGARSLVLRRAHAAFDAADAALVVAIGGDGTLLAASHNVGSTPILGVNSAPGFSVGFFCGAERKDVQRALGDALDGRMESLTLTRMSVSVNGRERSRRVLNDALYCHTSPAATSRYLLSHKGRREAHKSSGFWLGPAAGSTAAQRSAGGRVLPLGSKKLQVVVREPYAPPGTRYRLLRFEVGPNEKLEAQSMMQEACMFLDGPYRCISVSLGDVATFRVSPEPLQVLGLGRHVHTRRRQLAR
ncbi:MAG: NAD(+)/NADH kinase [Myxococcales bacterium]|nr:NAD(+)/NADH kinase [Myxococcales bacterium]